jgi:hypothetical protein
MFRNYRVVFLSDATATFDYPDRGFGSMPNAAHVMPVADMAARAVSGRPPGEFPSRAA